MLRCPASSLSAMTRNSTLCSNVACRMTGLNVRLGLNVFVELTIKEAKVLVNKQRLVGKWHNAIRIVLQQSIQLGASQTFL
mmetsp:Transcript_8997/g.6761  ORF Transcript_8997/g.6761 Transcript_8997/m.6761 type:complete len:81 (-) Transcript_8997:1664-1906(-)